RSRLVLCVQSRAARAARADVRTDQPLACAARSADDRARNERHRSLDRRLARCTDVLLELPARDEHTAGAGGGLRDPSRRAGYLPRARWRRDLPVGTGEEMNSAHTAVAGGHAETGRVALVRRRVTTTVIASAMPVRATV